MYVSERTCSFRSRRVFDAVSSPSPVTDITHILASGMQVISPFGDAGPVHVKEATVGLGRQTDIRREGGNGGGIRSIGIRCRLGLRSLRKQL